MDRDKLVETTMQLLYEATISAQNNQPSNNPQQGNVQTAKPADNANNQNVNNKSSEQNQQTIEVSDRCKAISDLLKIGSKLTGPLNDKILQVCTHITGRKGDIINNLKVNTLTSDFKQAVNRMRGSVLDVFFVNGDGGNEEKVIVGLNGNNNIVDKTIVDSKGNVVKVQ